MSLEPFQQLAQILDKSKNVLILTAENPSGDVICSAWAFYFFLQKRKIETTIALTDEFKEIERYSFLPKPEKITDNIHGSQDFLLLFNTKYNNISNVRTEKEGDEFKIFITPEKGSIDPRDFSFVPSKFKFDLLVIFGSSDKESIGKIYAESPDIFYEVPMINIDNKNDNENFGQINLVNMTASSVSEIVAENLEKIDSELIDQNIAECLLAGIISATESFQKKNTTPKSLQFSAKLMEKGADQQKINRHLFKTQPLNLLKLWGRVMVHLNWDESLGLAWSELSLEDFVQSRTMPTDVPFVLEKIKDNYSSGKIFMVLFQEKPGTIMAMMKFAQNEMLHHHSKVFSGEIKKEILTVRLEKEKIEEVITEIISKLKS
jgi:nanoRNase/pAp phosphatase (c-di-AMP/oligoRNAs hydrolase)